MKKLAVLFASLVVSGAVLAQAAATKRAVSAQDLLRLYTEERERAWASSMS